MLLKTFQCVATTTHPWVVTLFRSAELRGAGSSSTVDSTLWYGQVAVLWHAVSVAAALPRTGTYASLYKGRTRR
eukprot:scaffold475960_cov27-Prasinocladus_malaysianus.AAC.1